MAAAQLLREYVPYLRVRVVNVVDLMALLPDDDHPHGFSDDKFERAVHPRHATSMFAFHGYPRAIHELLHGRTNPGRFHVRGFIEQGTTTTPFDMVVLNRMSRYHLVLEALRRARRVPEHGTELGEFCEAQLARHHDYVREHLEDMPEVSTGSGSREPPILALNPGSSSLKAALRDPELRWSNSLERIDDTAALDAALDSIAHDLADQVVVAGGRLASGGARRAEPLSADRRRRRRCSPT